MAGRGRSAVLGVLLHSVPLAALRDHCPGWAQLSGKPSGCGVSIRQLPCLFYCRHLCIHLFHLLYLIFSHFLSLPFLKLWNQASLLPAKRIPSLCPGPLLVHFRTQVLAIPLLEERSFHHPVSGQQLWPTSGVIGRQVLGTQ